MTSSATYIYKENWKWWTEPGRSGDSHEKVTRGLDKSVKLEVQWNNMLVGSRYLPALAMGMAMAMAMAIADVYAMPMAMP